MFRKKQALYETYYERVQNEEVPRGSQELHNEKFHDLRCSLDVTEGDNAREDEMYGTCITHGVDER